MVPGAKLQQASVHIGAGRFEQARRLLQGILQAAPRDPVALKAMAYVLAQLGESEPALHYARLAAQTAPTDPEAQATLGTILCQRSEWMGAVEALTRAASLAPGVATTRMNLGNALWSLNRCAESLSHLQAAAHADPNDPDALSQLSMKLRMAGRAEQAVDVARAGCARFSGHRLLIQALTTAMVYDAARAPQ